DKILAAKTPTKARAQLKKDKANALNTKLKEIENDKKNQIKEVQSEIRSLNKQLAALEKEKLKQAAQE
ncbi:MAG: hypothetical protein ACFE9C_14820, partial [Candidatus Hodarchaeota archaeon]